LDAGLGYKVGGVLAVKRERELSAKALYVDREQGEEDER